MIDLYPTYRSSTRRSPFLSQLNHLWGRAVIPFFSCRSAMLTGLQAFGLTRLDEIFVPPYLSHCVLAAISRTVFPAMAPSPRTRAILVFHQFGFPQQIDAIQEIAKKYNWIIVNDCAHTLFTKARGRFLFDWGDLSVFSFAKLYPCGLGGGALANRIAVADRLAEAASGDQQDATEAFDFYREISEGCYGDRTPLKIQSFYGCLPDIKTLAPQALDALPDTEDAIRSDGDRRRRIYRQARDLFGDRVPSDPRDEVVPFAIPIHGEDAALFRLAESIKDQLKMDAPVLHFDYAQNMLKPDYRKALVVGCHEGWSENRIYDIFQIVKDGLR
jgi:hypothetical protein